MKTKTMQVIMLSTNNSSYLYRYEPKDHDDLIYYRKDIKSELSKNIKPQHLYIVSDNEIKEGDYAYDPDNKEIFKVKGSADYNCIGCKKIEATANDSLQIEAKDGIGGTTSWFLPQIPQSFIKEFAESNGTIKEAEVDLEEYQYSKDFEHRINNLLRIKTTPNNEIIIHPSKPKTYTREEVIDKIKSALLNASDLTTTYPDGTTNDILMEGTYGFNNWIEENL